MSSESGLWCLIESDPGVFTEMIHSFGVKGLQVEELYGLEEECFIDMQPVFGLIFLFKVPKDYDTKQAPQAGEADHIYFAQQVIQNACATQAIINLLLNCESADVELGEILGDFKSFTSSFDPTTRGLSLTNSDRIRTVHNSFSRQQVFDMSVKAQEDDDVYHYVTYLPVHGCVYELDGLQNGPINVGRIAAGASWLDVARPALQQRIAKYGGGELGFNLMAVVGDRRMGYQKEMEELTQRGMDDDEMAKRLYELQTKIDAEEAKLARFREENIRRRHNYLPFIVELLKILAREDKLVGMIKRAKEEAATREKGKDGKKKKNAEVKA